MAQHMKRIATPRSWPLHRKENTFVAVPKGSQKDEYALSVGAVFKEILGIAKTTKEVRYILYNKEVLVNGRKILSEKAKFGLFDVLAIPETKQYFTMVLNTRGKLDVKELSDKEASTKLTKIVGKTYLPGKKVQLNLFEGSNITVDKDTYKVGDALVVSLPKYEIKEHIKLENGVSTFLLSGQHIAKVVKVGAIKEGEIVCKADDVEFSVQKKQIFIVGKTKPILNI